MSGKIISRIHKYISSKLMADLEKICHNVLIPDNNKKVRMIKAKLDEYDVAYNELGPGTNRFAVTIDGYVFKIAMDKLGKLDNANEFTMSKELQPYVIKVYENNDLISVSEYVTLVSREEFMDSREDILDILSIIGESYLMGDVGFIEKNFTNWGYRDDGQMTILDFAYIHNIEGREMLCTDDGVMLDYTENFHSLRCPKCSKKYSFSNIRSKIPMETEWKYINDVKNESYQLLTPSINITEEGKQTNKPIRNEEEFNMLNDKEREEEFDLDEEEIEEGYDDIFNMMANRNKTTVSTVKIEESVEVTEEVTEVVEYDIDDVEEIDDDPVSAADILREQAEELLETADRVEANEIKLEIAKVENAELEVVLAETEDKVFTLSEALDSTNFDNVSSEPVARDESTVVVNVITPSSVTQVAVEATEVEVIAQSIIDDGTDEPSATTVDTDSYMVRMQKAYHDGQKKEITPVKIEVSKKENVEPVNEKNNIKYEKMAAELGYDID